ncbi:MAG: hypothetical protein ACPLZD_00190 [Candidatus Saccharicenans sp.]|nr:MAG: hypothetical protein C0168_05410 [Candidatus Aminicenantes bacterium]HEK85825.1 hypothetical protein [Candidatus Aminicenantes bacterium]
MKGKNFLRWLVVASLFWLAAAKSFAQNQSFPVAGAEVQVKINDRAVKCHTGEDGHFGLLFSDIKAIETKGPDINVFFTIKPPKNFKLKVQEKRTFIRVSKDDGPYFELVLSFDPSSGKFVVKRDNSIKGKPTGIKREKGDASKVGDKYMPQVAHF